MSQDPLAQAQELLKQIESGVRGLPQGTDVSQLASAIGQTTQQVTSMLPITQEAPQLTIPEVESPTKSAENLMDRTAGIEDRLAQMETERQRIAEESKAERDRLIAEQRTLAEKASDFIRGRSVEDKMREEQQRFEIPETMEKEREALAQARELQQKAILLQEQRDAAIGALGHQAISTPFISGQQARIAEAYDRRIASTSAIAGTQLAYAEALRGNVSQARALIGDIVNAYTYDTELELNRINMFMDLNREEIGMLDRDYQNAIQESQRYWENQLAQERAEREAVLNMSLNFLDAGIGLNDDIETALKKAQQWSGIQPDADVKQLMAQFPMAGIEEKDTFTEAINKIAKWQAEEQALQPPEAPPTPQIFGSAATGYMQQYYNPETNRWETRSVMGPAPAGTPSIPSPTSTQLEKWGLPPIVGIQPWEQTLSDLTKTEPVAWFKEYIQSMEERDAREQNRTPRKISPQETKSRWDDYSGEILWGTTEDPQKDTNIPSVILKYE